MVRAYVGAVSPRTLHLLMSAQATTAELGLPSDEVDMELNSQLYFLVVMMVRDAALRKVRLAAVGHGAEAWR
eukprot:7668980-Lingulodinium_polyedra.AAC.1